MVPSSRFALSLKPSVAYLVLNFCALWKKQTSRYPGAASDDVVAGGRPPRQSTGVATGTAPAATPVWPGPLPRTRIRTP